MSGFSLSGTCWSCGQTIESTGQPVKCGCGKTEINSNASILKPKLRIIEGGQKDDKDSN